jgi:hypothetical protein
MRETKAPQPYFLAMSGRWCLKTRLGAPLRLFTSAETAKLGYSTSRWDAERPSGKVESVSLLHIATGSRRNGERQ